MPGTASDKLGAEIQKTEEAMMDRTEPRFSGQSNTRGKSESKETEGKDGIQD